MIDELTRLTLRELAGVVRRGEVSPVEVVEAYVRRIEEANPRVNAVVTLAPDALDCARRAEAALLRRGEARGALEGVPLTVKDTIETEGLRATSGTRLRAGFVPERDAPSVARLRGAGAIVLGKTNTSELALDYTAENPVFGRTNNPHSTAHTTGGSSGGCAAAVAACMSAGSLGSDLVGSIRIPAHFCGVVGLKPTAGCIPGAGHCPPTIGAFSLAASLGPLARRVEDVALLYEVLSAARGAFDVGRSAIRAEDVIDLRGRRVGCYTDDGVARVTDETRTAVERAARALAEAGLTLVDERPPGVEHGARLWMELFAPATQEFLSSMFAGREGEGGASVQSMLERGRRAPEVALREYLRAWAERDERRARLAEWMRETPLLVAPVGAVAAFEHGVRKVTVGEEQLSVFRAFSYAQTFNVYDLPAVSVPAGLTSEGLPIGVQVIGRPRAEREVLAAAAIIEAATGGWRMPAAL